MRALAVAPSEPRQCHDGDVQALAAALEWQLVLSLQPTANLLPCNNLQPLSL